MHTSLVAQKVKNLFAMQEDLWVGKIPCKMEWLPAPVFLPGEFRGQRCLVGRSPWSHKESDTIEPITLSLSEKQNTIELAYVTMEYVISGNNWLFNK